MSFYQIDENSFVSDIVSRYYQTADVFRKYDIDFCCNGKWPLNAACESRGLNTGQIKKELEAATRVIHVPNFLAFHDWSIDFTIEYIINIHHVYLKQILPPFKEQLEKFADGHRQQFSYLPELKEQFGKLYQEIIPHLQHEETIIFPYIKHLAHAFYSKSTYGRLMIKTLRKPVEELMIAEHEMIGNLVQKFRELTNNYSTPENACTNHKVIFLKLRELDNDLVQHIHLENDILFPKAIQMEKELLEQQ